MPALAVGKESKIVLVITNPLDQALTVTFASVATGEGSAAAAPATTDSRSHAHAQAAAGSTDDAGAATEDGPAKEAKPELASISMTVNEDVVESINCKVRFWRISHPPPATHANGCLRSGRHSGFFACDESACFLQVVPPPTALTVAEHDPVMDYGLQEVSVEFVLLRVAVAAGWHHRGSTLV